MFILGTCGVLVGYGYEGTFDMGTHSLGYPGRMKVPTEKLLKHLYAVITDRERYKVSLTFSHTLCLLSPGQMSGVSWKSITEMGKR